jgi:hypothetical protein
MMAWPSAEGAVLGHVAPLFQGFRGEGQPHTGSRWRHCSGRLVLPLVEGVRTCMHVTYLTRPKKGELTSA